MMSNKKHMRHDRVRTNNWRAVLLIIICAMLIILVLAHSPSSLYAQMQSGKVDFIGIYRFSGQSNSHLEFATRDGKLIVMRVYDNPDLKKKYGERESFFEATLDGREFSGTMTSSSMDKGLPISGKISRDRRTIEWVGKDSEGVQYTSIVYKEEQEEPKKEEPKQEPKVVPEVVAKEEPKVARNRQFTQEVDLGFAAYKNKQYDEAISHHQKALQIDPGNKDAFKVYCALGANYFRKGLLDEALNEAQKCLDLNANYGVGNGFMGDILSRRGNRTSACMYYKKGCDLGTAFSCNNYKSQCLNK